MKGKLGEQLNMANQILMLAELARKVETEQEKASQTLTASTPEDVFPSRAYV